jgi:hypothetical protein
MLPRADAGGLQASTVTYFGPSASCAIRDHSHSLRCAAAIFNADEVIE